MCDIDADDVADHWSRTWYRSRKPKQCECCGRAIHEGEHYEAWFTVTHGDASSCACCAQCAVALDAFGREHHYYPWPGSFCDYLAECVIGDAESLKKWGPSLDMLRLRNRLAIEART